MSDDLVKRARDALDGVTPGPWERDMSYQWPSKVRSLDEKHRHRWVVDVPSFPDNTHTLRDARFIAASRELVPAMAERIEELEAKLRQSEPSDGRPCSTDEFLVVLLEEVEGNYDLRLAIKDWVEGGWGDAVAETSLQALMAGKG